MNPRGKSLRHARFALGIVRCFVLLALLATVPAARASGGAGEYSQTDVWNTENGMPSSSVTAIAQTPDGYLWVGTYNGLARFDGVRFVTFDPANTPALTHARVRRLFVDSQGTLWINTYDGSLTTLRDGKFTLEMVSEHRRGSRGGVAHLDVQSGDISLPTRKSHPQIARCAAAQELGNPSIRPTASPAR